MLGMEWDRLISGWMLDNINRQVGDGVSTLFWDDPWLEGKPLGSIFPCMYELVEKKLVTVAEMFARGWGVNGEAWKWRRRLFEWEEKLLGECIVRLTSFSLQVDRVDRWIWMLHDSNCYTVSSAYYFLTDIELDSNQQPNGNFRFLWLKAVPLKVLIFAWRLFLNRIPTRDKLFQRKVLLVSEHGCIANCGINEDIEHLFLTCCFFGGVWNIVAIWLGFSSAFHCQLFAHLHQFSGLRGFSKKSTKSMQIIWLSVA